MVVIELATKEEFDKFLTDAGSSLVVIDFYATWCGPCRVISPKFEKMSEEDKNKNIFFAKVDVDQNGDTSEACEISAMPTFQFFKNGKKVAEVVGASESKLADYLSMGQ